MIVAMRCGRGRGPLRQLRWLERELRYAVQHQSPATRAYAKAIMADVRRLSRRRTPHRLTVAVVVVALLLPPAPPKRVTQRESVSHLNWWSTPPTLRPVEIDLDDGRWPYQRLADLLRRLIETGRYRDGERLPSRRELMAEHRLSGATVAHAINVLQRLGLVHAKQGVGVLVRHSPAGARWARAMVDWVGTDRAVYELGLALGLWPEGSPLDDVAHRPRARRQLAAVLAALVDAELLECEQASSGEQYRVASPERAPGQMAIPVG
jgi:regulatory GntR family protein